MLTKEVFTQLALIQVNTTKPTETKSTVLVFPKTSFYAKVCVICVAQVDTGTERPKNEEQINSDIEFANLPKLTCNLIGQR